MSLCANGVTPLPAAILLVDPLPSETDWPQDAAIDQRIKGDSSDSQLESFVRQSGEASIEAWAAQGVSEQGRRRFGGALAKPLGPMVGHILALNGTIDGRGVFPLAHGV